MRRQERAGRRAASPSARAARTSALADRADRGARACRAKAGGSASLLKNSGQPAPAAPLRWNKPAPARPPRGRPRQPSARCPASAGRSRAAARAGRTRRRKVLAEAEAIRSMMSARARCWSPRSPKTRKCGRRCQKGTRQSPQAPSGRAKRCQGAPLRRGQKRSSRPSCPPVGRRSAKKKGIPRAATGGGAGVELMRLAPGWRRGVVIATVVAIKHVAIDGGGTHHRSARARDHHRGRTGAQDGDQGLRGHQGADENGPDGHDEPAAGPGHGHDCGRRNGSHRRGGGAG